MGILSGIERPNVSDTSAWADFTCGNCGRLVNGFVIAKFNENVWLFCPSCKRGSIHFRDAKVIYPAVLFGPYIQGLPEEVAEAYDEARRSMSANAVVGAELLCRKILMHVAVDKGAKEGGSFESYIDYLEKAGFITPTMKPWVDLIRQHGNMATHTLEKPDEERAKHTITFTAELLRVVYEMEFLAKKVEQK